MFSWKSLALMTVQQAISWFQRYIPFVLDGLRLIERHHDLVAIIVLLPTALWALLIFRDAKKKEASQRLHKLFESFYLTPEFRRIRIELEFDYTTVLSPLIERVLQDDNASFDSDQRLWLSDLDTSMNYLEFVLHLEDEGEISAKNSSALFEFWFSLLQSSDRASLRLYLARFGYESLAIRLAEMDELRLQKKRVPNLIAFYGTLRPSSNRSEFTRLKGLKVLDKVCRIRGIVYDLGDYPGLLPGDGEVEVEICELVDPKVLQSIDEYEEYRLTQPADSLFVRFPIQLPGTPEECWIYFYNQSVTGKPRTKS